MVDVVDNRVCADKKASHVSARFNLLLVLEHCLFCDFPLLRFAASYQCRTTDLQKSCYILFIFRTEALLTLKVMLFCFESSFCLDYPLTLFFKSCYQSQTRTGVCICQTRLRWMCCHLNANTIKGKKGPL